MQQAWLLLKQLHGITPYSTLREWNVILQTACHLGADIHVVGVDIHNANVQDAWVIPNKHCLSIPVCVRYSDDDRSVVAAPVEVADSETGVIAQVRGADVTLHCGDTQRDLLPDAEGVIRLSAAEARQTVEWTIVPHSGVCDEWTDYYYLWFFMSGHIQMSVVP